MPINPFFDNYNNTPEQILVASLNIQAIQQHGYEMLYLPRRKGKVDDVLNEDTMSYFDTAYPMEMYIRSVDGFEGEGSFLSKFGLEVRDRVTLAVARKRFYDDIGIIEDISRPMEGDLIYFMVTKKLFEIVYSDNRAIFYPVGTLPLFDLTCEVFEYSTEVFETGIADIDAITTTFSMDETPHRLQDQLGDYLFNDDGTHSLDAAFDLEVIDPGFDNDVTKQEAIELTNVIMTDPFRRR